MRALSLPLQVPVRAYQIVIAPQLPSTCRFFPSCSHYALLALDRHGALLGAALAVWRLARCQPLGTPGYDPVP